MSKNTSDNTIWLIMTAVFLIAIVIAVYLLYRKKEEESWIPSDLEEPPVYPQTVIPDHSDPATPPPDTTPGDSGTDPDPYTPAGFEMIPLSKTVSDKHSITFNFDKIYYATLLSGNLRPGGKVYTNVRIYYKKGGSWRHISTVGGWPDGFTNFSTTINDYCEGIKFEAEQGLMPWLGERYVDEVQGQLMIEV